MVRTLSTSRDVARWMTAPARSKCGRWQRGRRNGSCGRLNTADVAPGRYRQPLREPAND